MPNHIDDAINKILTADAQKNALDFAEYLLANDMVFERGKGYWEDKYYYMIKCKGEYVCFILIGGDERKDDSWTIWSDDSGSMWFKDYPLDEHTKKIAHANVDFCGNCGSCSGGTSKTIFGKTFDNVCRTTFRFDNPNHETVECAKKIIEIRINNIHVMYIPGHKNISKIESINRGWSCDKKYCVVENGTKYLLRITPIEKSAFRKEMFGMMQCVSALGVPMCQPIEFGICDSGVFSLQSWIDGEDLENVLPLLSETEQYVLGLKSGEILRKIHSIPAPNTQEGWATRFGRKTDYKIKKYHECGVRFEGDDAVLDYIEQNRHLLKNRPQCFQHGDYHVGNMMIENGELYIIDFDRYDFGDPWEEFNRIVWCAQKSPHFATGQLRGYFGGSPSNGLEPPIEFFKLLAFYIASNTLSSIYWALDFDDIELETMMNQAKDVLSWYNNMKNVIPTWYLKDFYIQYIDGVPFKLKSPFDFSFISKYGTVFKVFDDQDSGNICFGVKVDDGKRYFIKFAGAPTDRANIGKEEAVANLKHTVPIYQDLVHENLIKFIKAEDIGGGFAMIFEWVDAECMGRMYPRSRQKFMQIPLEKKVQVFEDILAFHAYVVKCGYVAIDFYDGSIMYDFENRKTVICDIDFYIKKPYINNMGRLWGSSRFMSPEEFTLGAEIDEITNVYVMGATAFALFSNYDRSRENWALSEAFYKVVEIAVNNDRNKRQQSIQQFIEEWEAAK